MSFISALMYIFVYILCRVMVINLPNNFILFFMLQEILQILLYFTRTSTNYIICYKNHYKLYYNVTYITTNCIIMLHTSLQSVLYATIVNTQFTTRCIQLNYIITWFIFNYLFIAIFNVAHLNKDI